ncbi:hypothetical protein PENTCL1PPCAC_2532 [Pristionchus entomophagus]|uniref:PDZ domain-containing protein n=1 Tax=Pristionchus entomophagus TaxID=358040 RepID=A0AAV5SCU5_9BILA|nr:hypothetical protein PENTCL1PPCAC_2532 [Pristionchus entomophagus]
MADEKCLSDGQLVGAIIGSIIGTLAICAGVAAALFWFFYRKQDLGGRAKVAPIDVESSSKRVSRPGTPKKTMKDQVTMIDSFKLERKHFGTQKSFSTENVNDVEAAVQICADDLSGLGFHVKGNMTDGIYVKSVAPKGPADECGNILVDDRIRSLTISFDGMVYEDAVTLLSYASPYQVKFVLERRLADGFEVVDSESVTSPKVHPLFRSNTLTHCHFNPCSPSSSPSPPPYVERVPTPPKKMVTPSPPPISPEPIGDLPEESISPPIVVVEKVEEYAVVERVMDEQPAPIIVEESIVIPEPEPEVASVVTVVVEETPKMISSDYSSDHSCKGEEASETSSETHEPTMIDEKLEIVSPTPSQHAVISPPSPRAVAEKMPPKKKVSTGIPIKRTPTQKRDGTSVSPLQMTDARVSRIPKRDSMKTPIVERKLPALPKSALQKKESTPDSSDIWSRLYQEKKGALRKTRESKTPEPGQNNNVMTTSTTSNKSDQYGTLSRDRQARLTENDEILERQQEELRQLGVL